jgi:hypothetical protein
VTPGRGVGAGPPEKTQLKCRGEPSGKVVAGEAQAISPMRFASSDAYASSLYFCVTLAIRIFAQLPLAVRVIFIEPNLKFCTNGNCCHHPRAVEPNIGVERFYLVWSIFQ